MPRGGGLYGEHQPQQWENEQTALTSRAPESIELTQNISGNNLKMHFCEYIPTNPGKP